MVKIILMGGVFLLTLAGTLAGLLAMEGKLSAEGIQALTNPEGYAEIEAKRQAETKANEPAIGTLAQQLNDRAEKLDMRETGLDEREKQLKQREDDLDKARADLEMLQKSIDGALDAASESRKTQLKAVAITMENMEPQGAAQRLETMETDKIAEILLFVNSKKQGPILEAMAQEVATRVIEEMVNAGDQ
jgi:flagellar motility protein MotE (MotC chaperone)